MKTPMFFTRHTVLAGVTLIDALACGGGSNPEQELDASSVPTNVGDHSNREGIVDDDEAVGISSGDATVVDDAGPTIREPQGNHTEPNVTSCAEPPGVCGGDSMLDPAYPGLDASSSTPPEDGGAPAPDSGTSDHPIDSGTSCGNGILDQDEACDDGNTVPDDGCDHDCEAESPLDIECGNAILEEGELCDPCPSSCDDGNACTTDTLSGADCSAECTSTPVISCGSDGCCPGGSCNATNDPDCSPSCGNGTQEGDENCASCPEDAPCAIDGYTCFAGQCTECGGNGQPCCSTGTACEAGDCKASNGICQPIGASLLWSEDFESFSWDHIGQGTLPDGIDVWDVDSILRTLTGGGATGNGLTWWGGSSSGVASSATMTLPPVVQAGRNAELRFQAYYAFPGTIQIFAGRSTCPSTTIEISSEAWNLQTVPLADCGSSGRIVFQLGNLYEVATGGQALKFDDIDVYYLD